MLWSTTPAPCRSAAINVVPNAVMTASSSALCTSSKTPFSFVRGQESTDYVRRCLSRTNIDQCGIFVIGSGRRYRGLLLYRSSSVESIVVGAGLSPIVGQCGRTMSEN